MSFSISPLLATCLEKNQKPNSSKMTSDAADLFPILDEGGGSSFDIVAVAATISLAVPAAANSVSVGKRGEDHANNRALYNI